MGLETLGGFPPDLFTIAESLVQITSRHSSSKEEMTWSLQRRFGALASAHGLVRRNFLLNDKGVEARDLADVVRAIIAPYDGCAGLSRFAVAGESIGLGDHALNGVALIVNELTTNTLKYGSLAVGDGDIAIRWKPEGENLVFDWVEHGGARDCSRA